MRSFKTLHNYLERVDDLQSVDTMMYLKPFLDVIHSHDTSGAITAIALSVRPPPGPFSLFPCPLTRRVPPSRP